MKMYSIQKDNFYLYRHVIYVCYNVYFTRVFLYSHVKKLRQEYILATCLAVFGWTFDTAFTCLFCPNVPLFFRLENNTVLAVWYFYFSSSFIKVRLFKCCICLCQ